MKLQLIGDTYIISINGTQVGMETGQPFVSGFKPGGFGFYAQDFNAPPNDQGEVVFSNLLVTTP